MVRVKASSSCVRLPVVILSHHVGLLTLGTSFVHRCLRYRAVEFGIGQRAVKFCSWEALAADLAESNSKICD